MLRNKLCECGCGAETRKITKKNAKFGHVVGEHFRFIKGHHNRVRFGNKNSHWKGGSYVNDSGYKMVYYPGHERASSNGYVREHILIAEKALGKALPEKSQVHHWGETLDNSRLVICEDQIYHQLLHIRAKSLHESGDPNKRKCKFCGSYDNVENLHCVRSNRGHGWNVYHLLCAREYDRKRKNFKNISGVNV